MKKTKSQLGNKKNFVASTFPIYFTNDPINNFDGYTIPPSSILISSPIERIDNEKDSSYIDVDTCEPAVAISDVNGNLLPLSYTMDMTYFKLDGNRLVLDVEKVINNNISYFTANYIDKIYFDINNKGQITLDTGKILTIVNNNFDKVYSQVKERLQKEYVLTPQKKSPVTLPPSVIK